jgi:phosphoribosyl 1,2-cyclic phosphodiesterase
VASLWICSDMRCRVLGCGCGGNITVKKFDGVL